MSQVPVNVRVRREVTELATAYVDPEEFQAWAGEPLAQAQNKLIADFLTSGRDDPPLFDHEEQDDHLEDLVVIGLGAPA